MFFKNPYRITLPKMSTSQQLYRLQELDTEIELWQKNLQDLMARRGESTDIINLRSDLEVKKGRLEGLKKELRSLEIDANDITAKLKDLEQELYSGRIRNPKELSNIQHDIELLKSKSGKLDDEQLALMEEIDVLNEEAEQLNAKLRKLEEEWRIEQNKIDLEIENARNNLSRMESEYKKLVASLEPQNFSLYSEIKKKRKVAVVRVVQGICSGCRLQLPVTDLQKVRSGSIVQCSSCGRILYLA